MSPFKKFLIAVIKLIVIAIIEHLNGPDAPAA